MEDERWDIVPKPRVSCSSPLRSSEHYSRAKFVEEFQLAREQVSRFRNKMHGLAKQIDGIEADIRMSGDRVIEIEQDLTRTQETNINLQIRLENAVTRQRESDGHATRAIRDLHSDLAMMAYANNQLQDRLANLADSQKNQTGNASATVEKMLEYVKMLQEAQNSIHLLKQKPTTSVSNTRMLQEPLTSCMVTSIPVELTDIYRHRIIRKHTSLHGISSSYNNKQGLSSSSHHHKQEGLRILLD